MIVITCVDDNGGVLFNHRRQSSDRVVRQRILDICKGSKLWMSSYSAREFENTDAPEINVEDEFLSEAAKGEYCFVEGDDLKPYEKWIERIILIHWNRVYPADVYFDFPLNEHGWKRVSCEEFTGYSHDKITVETYDRP